MGVVHIERKTVASAALSDLIDRKGRVDTAVNILKAFPPDKRERPPIEAAKISGVNKEIVSFIIEMAERRKTLLDEIYDCAREMEPFKKWGDFKPEDVKFLNENGVTFLFYEVPYASYQKLQNERVIVCAAPKKENKVFLVAFDEIPGEYPCQLPEKPLSELELLIAKKRLQIIAVEKQLMSFYPHLREIEAVKKRLDAEIEFETARAGMDKIFTGDDEFSPNLKNSGVNYDISVFAGYVPSADVGIIKRAASENGWALYADDPAEDDDQVPTKLKNNKFFSLLYPLADFLEIVPGYREVDITGIFLLFFCVFFGMIFSDAGYGILLTLAAFIGMLKTAKKGVLPVFKMLLLLGICNVIWGVLTCTWFAAPINILPQVAQNLSLPLIVNVPDDIEKWLPVYTANNFWIQSGIVSLKAQVGEYKNFVDQNLMILCFSIALLHLGLAHVRGFFAQVFKQKSLKCFAELGQLAMLIGMFRVVLALVVDAKRFPFGVVGFENIWFDMLAGGFALVFIFGNYEGNIIKSIIASFANFISSVLGVTNVFSDIMSYIRLWAVGLAGGSLASTVNTMAGPMVGHFLTFAAILLFLFGHGFNMVLNVLSVIVHGVRLNTLEFSSHVGLTWSGVAYKPFAKRVL
jgi:V/A-type H+-transporting ATPase subunit I